jgi:replicative DNA helicase
VPVGPATFDEDVFVWAATTRPSDTKRLLEIFKPEWLSEAELVPILREIFSFTKEHGIPPSLKLLHDIFKSRDEDVYKLRIAPALKRIQARQPDSSETLYALSKVRDLSVVRSFQALTSSQVMLEREADIDGTAVLSNVHKWLLKFNAPNDEETVDIKTAVESLVLSHGFDAAPTRVPVGIKPLDDWSNGGLRTKQLGIIIAPTGGGKSSVLMNMAYKSAHAFYAPTWLVTNELSMFEQTERFLARMTGVSLQRIEDHPASGLGSLERNYWQDGLQDRLWLTSVNKETSAADLESIMERQANIYGWKPKLIVIDYMERMRPIETGYSRDQSWVWYGAIARDLCRLAKRHNLLVWTAAQTNRSGLNAEQITLDMTQGSTQHLQEAAMLVAFRQVQAGLTDNGDEQMAMEFFDLKARSAKRHGKSRIVKVNLETMLISGDEVEPSAIQINTPQEDEGERPKRGGRKSGSPRRDAT